MNPHREPLMPWKFGIHGLRHQASDLSAVQHISPSEWITRMMSTPEKFLIYVVFCRTNAFQGNASIPYERDAASPKDCSGTTLNPYKYFPKADHQLREVRRFGLPSPVTVRGTV